MDRRGCGLGTWNGIMLLEEDEVESFEIFNVNVNFCSTLDSLKRDFGIHIAIGLFSFLFDDLEIISSMMDFGTHAFLIIFFLDISFDFMPPSIRGDMVVFFFIWILELFLFLVLNIQVTLKRLGTCGRRRMI